MFNKKYIDDTENIIIKVNDAWYGVWEYVPYYAFCSKCKIPKSEIIYQGKNVIVCKCVKVKDNSFNLDCNCIEEKMYKSVNEIIQVVTFKYCNKGKWNCVSKYSFNPTVKETLTPLDVFKKEFYCKYKLIESEEEFNEYLQSSLDCDTWCQKKLYTKMKELGFDDYFIQYNAQRIGNDLNKYHRMINIANEIEDKDLLKQIFLMKFLDE